MLEVGNFQGIFVFGDTRHSIDGFLSELTVPTFMIYVDWYEHSFIKQFNKLNCKTNLA